METNALVQQQVSLSIVVIGNSLAVEVVPPRSRRTDGVYAEQLARRLRARGIAVDFKVEARRFGFITDAWNQYESVIRNRFPDVVIVHYGSNEYHPHVFPIPVLRHLFKRHETITPAQRWYRREVVSRILAVVRRYRRATSHVLALHTWHVRPTRFRSILAKIIEMCRAESRSLVLVMDVDRPSALLENLLPGVGARREVYQGVLEDLVPAFDDEDIRLCRVSELVAEQNRVKPSADGAHYSAELHDRVAALLESEILSWLETGRGPFRFDHPTHAGGTSSESRDPVAIRVDESYAIRMKGCQ
jgi:lysophospholipase L1-like esterase